MDEKIELKLTSQLPDKDSITASVRTLETMDSRASLFGHESSLQYSQTTTDPNNLKRKFLSKMLALLLIQLVITVVSVVAIVLSAIAVTYYFQIMNQQDYNITMLTEKVAELEHMINMNQTELDYATLQYQIIANFSDQIGNVTESVNGLQKQLNRNHDQLENQVDGIVQISQSLRDNVSQISHNLRTNITQLNSVISDNLGTITAISHTITALNSQVQSIDQNSTVNLYDKCIVDHQNCTGVPLVNIYWRVCRTPELHVNVPVSYMYPNMCIDLSASMWRRDNKIL